MKGKKNEGSHCFNDPRSKGQARTFEVWEPESAAD